MQRNHRWIGFGALLLLAVGASPAVARGRDRAERPKQEIWYHTGYPGGVVGPNEGMSALMGPTKMPHVFAEIVRAGLVPGSQLHTDAGQVRGRQRPAAPMDLASLRQVHTDDYLKAVLTGQPAELATSQGLPRWDANIARGWLLNTGGLFAAAETALQKNTITANLGHGYHHASPSTGMGFCTVNGLGVVAKKLAAQGKKVLIVDLDQHEGNGTADCVIGERNVWNVSIYGSYMGGPDATPNNRVLAVNHRAVEKGLKRDVNYLAAISSRLPAMIDEIQPDIIIYQAGMDPYDCAGITPEALKARDAYVFSLARTRNIPLTWVLAGGYTDVATLVRLHTGTVKAANEVLGQVNVGHQVVSAGGDAYAWSTRGRSVRFADWRALNEQLNGREHVQARRELSAVEVEEFMAGRAALMQSRRLPDRHMEQAFRGLFGDAP